ncbi:MAG: hypothetical protein RL757_751 [Bacteroidota bacterium]|jgi:hypothetical protein
MLFVFYLKVAQNYILKTARKCLLKKNNSPCKVLISKSINFNAFALGGHFF